jgi:hypothetical protein
MTSLAAREKKTRSEGVFWDLMGYSLAKEKIEKL